MLNVIMTVLEDVLNSKKEDLQTERELIRIHQQQRDELEKEIEALSFLLVHAPDLFKSKPPEAKWFYDPFASSKDEYDINAATTFSGMVKTAENMGYIQKQESEEKINTANVRNWQSKNVPPMQNPPPPPPKKESEDNKHKDYSKFIYGEWKSATINNPELLKYVRTQPSSFPNEKPVHIFSTNGAEYEFIYLSVSGDIPAALLRNLTFDHTEIPVPHTASIWYIFKDGIDTFPFEPKKRTGTNNY